MSGQNNEVAIKMGFSFRQVSIITSKVYGQCSELIVLAL